MACVVRGEALDVQRPVVADLVEGGQQRVPVGLVAARGAAVAAADLHVHEVRAGRAYGVGGRALLDVEVVGVQREPERLPQHAVERLEGLVDGVDQRGLVAVERLDADRDAAFARVVDDGCEVLRASRRTPPRARSARHPPDPAGGGVERPAHRSGADGRGQVDARPQVVLGRGHRGGIASRPGRAPGAIAPTTYGVRPVSARAAPTVSALRSPTFSSGISTASKPRSATVRSRVGHVVVGEGRDPHPRVDTDGSHGLLIGTVHFRPSGRSERRGAGQGIWRSCQTSG